MTPLVCDFCARCQLPGESRFGWWWGTPGEVRCPGCVADARVGSAADRRATELV